MWYLFFFSITAGPLRNARIPSSLKASWLVNLFSENQVALMKTKQRMSDDTSAEQAGHHPSRCNACPSAGVVYYSAAFSSKGELRCTWKSVSLGWGSLKKTEHSSCAISFMFHIKYRSWFCKKTWTCHLCVIWKSIDTTRNQGSRWFCDDDTCAFRQMKATSLFGWISCYALTTCICKYIIFMPREILCT